MHQQAKERLVCRDPAHVVVMQAQVEVRLAQALRPVDDQSIQPGAVGGQFVQVGEGQLLEIAGRGNAA